MVRELFGLVAVLVCVGVASAEPPAQQVLAKAKVPPRAGDACIVSCKAVNGMVFPVPGLGFVPVPVEVWRCEVWHTPPGAPAGSPRVRDVVNIFTWAE
jgi:hypothetical protein